MDTEKVNAVIERLFVNLAPLLKHANGNWMFLGAATLECFRKLHEEEKAKKRNMMKEREAQMNRMCDQNQYQEEEKGERMLGNTIDVGVGGSSPLSITLTESRITSTEGDIQYLCVSHDSKMIAVATTKCVFIYKVSSQQRVEMQIRESGVKWVDFSPDDNKIVVGGDSGQVHVYNTQSGGRIFSVSASGKISCVKFTPGGAKIVVATDHSILILSGLNGSELGKIELPNQAVLAMDISPCGNYVIFSSWADKLLPIRRYNINERRLESYPYDENLLQKVTSVRYSHDNSDLCWAITENGCIWVWDSRDFKSQYRKVINRGLRENIDETKEAEETAVFVTISPDDSLIISSNQREGLCIWSREDGQRVIIHNSTKKEDETERCGALAISRNSKLLVVARDHGAFSIFKVNE